MTTAMIIRSIFEVALILFTILAVLHEDRIAAQEKRLLAAIRRRKLKLIKGFKDIL